MNQIARVEYMTAERYLRALAGNIVMFYDADEQGLLPDSSTVILVRRSAEDFDLTVDYNTKDGRSMSVWLPLGCVLEIAIWSKDPIASMTAFPEEAKKGERSAVERTASEKVMAIFDQFVLQAKAA